jgi:hypothetical protein
MIRGRGIDGDEGLLLLTGYNPVGNTKLLKRGKEQQTCPMIPFL